MGHKGSMAHKYKAAAYMVDGSAAEGSPNANLNKGYGYESPGQERENLGKMPGAYKQMDSGGSWMSQHSNTSSINMNTPPPGSAVYQTNDGPTSEMFDVKSKKQMRYEKLAQKAENAIAQNKFKKNERLVNRANTLNKKNNLGYNDLAQG